MNENVLAVKNLYYKNFESFSPPKSPEVKVVELDRKIILDWGEDISATN